MFWFGVSEVVVQDQLAPWTRAEVKHHREDGTLECYSPETPGEHR